MKLYKMIKDNCSIIFALTEKNIRLRFRYKGALLFSYLLPLVGILMPLIVMAQIFEFSDRFGPWTAENYYIFLFVAYNINLLRQIIAVFPKNLRLEKFWNTVPALLIAPFNRINQLLSIFLSEIILISIPFTIIFILCYIIYPVSLITILSAIIIYIIIALIFSGIGLILGIFAISNESIWKGLLFGFKLVFWASCISYPFEIFPESIQSIINLNPFYYIFDILRRVWIEDDIILTITLHSLNLFILIITAILTSCIGVYTFNKIFKSYGIAGY